MNCDKKIGIGLIISSFMLLGASIYSNREVKEVKIEEGQCYKHRDVESKVYSKVLLVDDGYEYITEISYETIELNWSDEIITNKHKRGEESFLKLYKKTSCSEYNNMLNLKRVQDLQSRVYDLEQKHKDEELLDIENEPFLTKEFLKKLREMLEEE